MSAEWIWCKDRLPERGERVIGYDTLYYRVGEAERAGWHDGLDFIDSDDCDIVAWMLMPRPPTILPQPQEQQP
jgi:hypothetical protein